MASSQSAADAAYAEFYHRTPEFHPYNTIPNVTELAKLIVATWGETAADNSSSWEIAFTMLKDRLQPDPNYVSREFKTRADSMSVEEMKRAYQYEPGFKEQWERLSRADVPAASLSNDPYASLTVEQLKSIPVNTRAQKQAHEPMFQAAVERLAARHGQI